MAAPKSLEALDPALQACVAWLEDARIPALLIGGAAVGILSRPRSTEDLDWVCDIPEERMVEVLSAGKNYGIHTRISDPIAFSRKSSLLPLKHQPSQTPVDLALAVSPFEISAIRHKQIVVMQGAKLPLPRPGDLVVMKMVANRPGDHLDVARLLEMNPTIDLAYIRRWVREYARASDSPDIVENLERIIRAVRKESINRARRSAARKKRSRPKK